MQNVMLKYSSVFDSVESLDSEAAEVDLTLTAMIEQWPDIHGIKDVGFYAFGLDSPSRRARGKRLRSVLCSVVNQRVGGDRALGLRLAAAWEMFHQLAIVHDDIEDGDEYRRGRPSVWKRFGVPQAINIGDYLYSTAIRETLDLRRRGAPSDVVLEILDLMAETAVRTAEGQALDLSMRQRRDVSVEDYFSCVRRKTGDYLIAPAVSAARIGGAGPRVIEALRQFGDLVGPAFQIGDDLIDLTLGKGRDRVGSDIREGKRSLVVILASQRCSENERARLFDVLDAPRDSTTDAMVSELLDLFEDKNAIQSSQAELDRLLASSIVVLREIPDQLTADLAALARLLRRRSV